MADKRGTHDYVEDLRNAEVLVDINGKFYPRQDASISVFDSGFLLGDGVWEAIRLHNGKFLFLEQHLERSFWCASQIDMDIGKTMGRSPLACMILKNPIRWRTEYTFVL